MNSQSFDSIEDLRQHYCEKHLCEAPEEIFGMNCNMPAIIRANPGTCKDFCQDHPKEAAELMGYKVVEEKKNDNPKICDVLGVDVGEKFSYPGYSGKLCVSEDGDLLRLIGTEKFGISTGICDLINHPEKIIHEQNHTAAKFTAEEVEEIKVLQRVLFEKFDSVYCGRGKKFRLVYLTNNEHFVMFLSPDALPSLAFGESVRVEDIIENSEQES